MEHFKDIPGFNGLYKASKEGHILSVNYKRQGYPKILLPIKQNDGYFNINIYKDRKQKQFRLHRLITLTFMGYNKMDVNHIDGDKSNNRLDNLEYCTKSENHIHRYKYLGHKPGNTGMTGKKSPLSKRVDQYTLDGEFIKTWDSMMDISRNMGLDCGRISYCCNGKRNKAGGYKWKFKV